MSASITAECHTQWLSGLKKSCAPFTVWGLPRSRTGTTVTAPAAATVRSVGRVNSGPNLHVTLLLGVRFSDHSEMNSHRFLPFPVEYVLCACDREEATVRVRPTRDPPVKVRTLLTEASLSDTKVSACFF